MTPIEPIEINLDRSRKVLINHRALFKAEGEINKRRGAKVEDWASIDVLMVDAFNLIYRSRGMLPLDLLAVMIWASIVYENNERALTVEQITDLFDDPSVSRAALSGDIWGAYFKASMRNLKQLPPENEAEKKSGDTILTDGLGNGVLRESS